MNQHAEYQGQKSFSSKVIVRTQIHRHTDTHTDRLLYLYH